jgi:hypothetical protein
VERGAEQPVVLVHLLPNAGQVRDYAVLGLKFLRNVFHHDSVIGGPARRVRGPTGRVGPGGGAVRSFAERVFIIIDPDH